MYISPPSLGTSTKLYTTFCCRRRMCACTPRCSNILPQATCEKQTWDEFYHGTIKPCFEYCFFVSLSASFAFFRFGCGSVFNHPTLLSDFFVPYDGAQWWEHKHKNNISRAYRKSNQLNDKWEFHDSVASIFFSSFWCNDFFRYLFILLQKFTAARLQALDSNLPSFITLTPDIAFIFFASWFSSFPVILSQNKTRKH